jgi:peptidoglycan hydrolase CwlO-like protein
MKGRAYSEIELALSSDIKMLVNSLNEEVNYRMTQAAKTNGRCDTIEAHEKINNHKIETLQETILNLTKRVRELECKVYVLCPGCGQRLPEKV